MSDKEVMKYTAMYTLAGLDISANELIVIFSKIINYFLDSHDELSQNDKLKLARISNDLWDQKEGLNVS